MKMYFAFSVSILCALLLPYYVEATELKIKGCNIENLAPGQLSLDELNVSDKGITNSKLTFNSELSPSTVAVHVIINDEDGNSMMEQNVDLCSMSSSDIFKGYFLSFDNPDFNEGNCPIPAGTYGSGQFDVEIDDPPEGEYSVIFEILDGPSMIFRVQCNVEIA
ncbi:PREDICTED: uncharacterized protein LOC107065855 [Polistes dominula]|uniref:Uncharacterized protein LOC107065855 n=1 Tax=Polistes dominula TaxID=743375 RepID=A0ABM1I5A7_POLDO|nr:PREDICTED: uncharacterized protein LOC107065855 [Polistes dominula]